MKHIMCKCKYKSRFFTNKNSSNTINHINKFHHFEYESKVSSFNLVDTDLHSRTHTHTHTRVRPHTFSISLCVCFSYNRLLKCPFCETKTVMPKKKCLPLHVLRRVFCIFNREKYYNPMSFFLESNTVEFSWVAFRCRFCYYFCLMCDITHSLEYILNDYYSTLKHFPFVERERKKKKCEMYFPIHFVIMCVCVRVRGSVMCWSKCWGKTKLLYSKNVCYTCFG